MLPGLKDQENYLRLLSIWTHLGLRSAVLRGSEVCCDCPTPTCNPAKGASFLPGSCLSLLSFLSRSRKRCHPGLCCAPPAFLFLTRELTSSSPGPAEPWPPRLWQSSRGRRQAGVSKARAHTSSSLCCQQSWGHLLALSHGDPGVRLKRLQCSHSQGKAGI